jgi:RNA polymerase sigma-70 factor, ECF subfamily
VALRQEEFTVLRDDVDLERDRALVERCQRGDSAAFGNLYARYYERLLRFCIRRLSDRHEAEDATQEAFARAWKALPNFAGERRFYPWLTVIAGNICTDALRRRARSTPTEDLELGGSQPVGVAISATSDEMLLAAVDGELVHQAMDRLSVRHRHVLDMREGSGWTYQQMADHDGVEVGTIETVLWRARQALKREFTVLSESKGAFAGAFIGLGAFMRRGLLRLAHRSAVAMPHGGGGGGVVRTAFAGVVATSAAVAAVAFVTPHALPAPPPSPAGASSTAHSVSVPASSVPSSGGPASTGPNGAGTAVPSLTPGATTSTAGGATVPAGAGGLLRPVIGPTATGATGTSALSSVATATGSLVHAVGSGASAASGGSQAAGVTSPLVAVGSNPVLAPFTHGLLGLPAAASPLVTGVAPPAVAAPVITTLGAVASTASSAVAALTAPLTGNPTGTSPSLPKLPAVGPTLKGLLGPG